MTNLPTDYLGMLLGSRHKDVEIWNNIVEKTEKSSPIGCLRISLGEGHSNKLRFGSCPYLCDVLISYPDQSGEEIE